MVGCPSGFKEIGLKEIFIKISKEPIGIFPREFESHTDRNRYKTLLIYSNKKQLYSYKIVLQLGLLELSLSCNSGISDTGQECLCVKVIISM